MFYQRSTDPSGFSGASNEIFFIKSNANFFFFFFVNGEVVFLKSSFFVLILINITEV